MYYKCLFIFILLLQSCSFAITKQMSYKYNLKLKVMRQREEKAEYMNKQVYSLRLTGDAQTGYTYNVKVRVLDARIKDLMYLSLTKWIFEVVDAVEIYTGKRDLEMLFDKFRLNRIIANDKSVLIEGTNKGYNIVLLVTTDKITTYKD